MSVNPTKIALYKRGGYYNILYYSGGKRRWKTTGCRTKPEALARLIEFRELLKVRPQSVTLSKFVQDFLTFAEATYRPGTVALYRHTLQRFKSVAGDISLPEITAQHFDKFKANRLTAKTENPKLPRARSVASVSIELGTLKAVFATARRWGLVEQNAFSACSLCPVPERTPSYFSPEDFSRLVNSIRENWLREVVLFAVLTGARRGEILGLQWDGVNLEKRLVTIESGPTFKTKAGKRRVIPLNETAVYVLKGRQGKSPSPYVFTLNDRPIPEDWLTHLFKRCVLEANLSERLHFHSLRHTFASWLVQGGSTLYEVQKLLGHSSSKVTEIYSHLQPEHLHQTVNRIDLRLN
jgi:integrase